MINAPTSQRGECPNKIMLTKIQNMSKQTHSKRTTREMSAAQKAKIAASMQGKQHSSETKAKISAALKKYWAGIPCADGHPINEPSGMFDPTSTNDTSKPSNHA